MVQQQMITFKTWLVEESLAHKQAKSMGLKYLGFGRYGHGKKTEFHNEFGRLVKVKDPFKTNEPQLKHLEHVEDLIFNHGVNGTRHAIDLLHSVAEHLTGKDETNKIKMTTKVDGSPSVVWDHNERSIATKSAFAKEPKINRTHADVERNHPSEGLQTKLKAALTHFPKLKLNGKYQGDMLFTEQDKEIHKINGVDHVTFRPNTITYAAPVNLETGKKILRAKVGVSFHTAYDKMGKMIPGADISHIAQHPDVFHLDTTFKPNEDLSSVKVGLQNIGAQFRNIHPDAFRVVTDPEVLPLVKQFINKNVREDSRYYNANGLMEYIHTYLTKKADSLKTEKSKAPILGKMQAIINQVSRNSVDIDKILQLHAAIGAAKDSLIDIMNRQHQYLSHFLGPEHEPTNPEGYVLIGPRGVSKFVKRSEFSKNNFNMQKNWGNK